MTDSVQEVSGVLSRVNQLGLATEMLFSRLYQGLSRKSQPPQPPSKSKNAAAKGKQPPLPPDDPQRRKMLQAIKRRDIEIERLNGILASIDEGIVMQDLQGKVVLINAAAHKLIGNRKEFWDSEIGSLFNAYQDVTKVESEIAPLGEPSRIQINNMIVGAQVAAVADGNGQRLGTMIVLRDVTKDALAERLKDQFITAISHELRTPMTVIKGMSEVIMGQPAEKPPPRRMLESLSRNVDILDRMIVELLDMTEMTADTFSIRHDPLNLQDLIWNVVRGMTPEVKKARLDVKVMTKGTGGLEINGDGERLRWALGHLLQNSIRYTEAGGHIVITAGPTGDNQVAIQVIDNGVGISKRDLPHVFDRFYRGEPRTKSGKLLDPRGLGQGLFVARTVTEAHGGYLSVHSDVGQGSIFTLVLPVGVQEAA